MAQKPSQEPKKTAPQGEERRVLVAPESELEVLRARQRLAITLGVVALLLMLTAGSIAFFLMQRYQQGLMQTPVVNKPSPTGLLQAPQPTQQQAPSFAQVPEPPSPSTSLLQAPPPPPVPTPLQTVQPMQPTQPAPQQPPIPAGLLDYLEQLRRIEQQRKREASNVWVALQALNDLLKAMQGVAASGDILDAPDYNPQETLKAYDAYQQRFIALRQWLHRLNPPPECLQLHQAYDQALLSHINAVGSLKQRIVLKDLAGAALSGLTLQKQIDAALSMADDELSAVCQRYGIVKFFTIGDK